MNDPEGYGLCFVNSYYLHSLVCMCVCVCIRTHGIWMDTSQAVYFTSIIKVENSSHIFCL